EHWPNPAPRCSSSREVESADCRDAGRACLATTLQWKPRGRITQRRRSRLAIWRTTYCRHQGHWPTLVARYPTGHAVAPTYRRGTTPFWWMAAVRRQRPRQCTTWRRWPMYAKWPVKHHRRRREPSQPTPRCAIGPLVALTHCRGTIPSWHAAVRRPRPQTRTTRVQQQWPMQTSFRDVDTYAPPVIFSSLRHPTRTNRNRRIGLQKSLALDAGFGKRYSQSGPASAQSGSRPRRRTAAAFPDKPRDTIIIVPSPLRPCARRNGNQCIAP